MNLPSYNDRTSSLAHVSNISNSKRNQQITSWVHHLPHIHGDRSSLIRSSCTFGVGTNKNSNTNARTKIRDDQYESSTSSLSSSSSSSSSVMSPRTRLNSSTTTTPSSRTRTTNSSSDNNCPCCAAPSDSQTSLLVLLDVNPSILVSSSSAQDDEEAARVLNKQGPAPRRTSWNKKTDASFSCDRSVHFSSSVQCRFIESRRRMIKKSRSSRATTRSTTTRVISSYWYDEGEMAAIHNEMLDTVQQMRARESRPTQEPMTPSPRLSSADEDKEPLVDLCVRGLERYRRHDVMTDRSMQDRVDSIDSVLRMQAIMKRRNDCPMMDHTLIAQTYSRFSLRSQHLAIIRAKSDETYVNQHVRQGNIAVE